jgi:hypothetical protein
MTEKVDFLLSIYISTQPWLIDNIVYIHSYKETIHLHHIRLIYRTKFHINIHAWPRSDFDMKNNNKWEVPYDTLIRYWDQSCNVMFLITNEVTAFIIIRRQFTYTTYDLSTEQSSILIYTPLLYVLNRQYRILWIFTF